MQNRQIVLYLMLLLGAVGALSYSKLGQSEDPPFTFKAMVVQTNWPGASAEEVARQVTERIEKKLMETGDYDRIVSFSPRRLAGDLHGARGHLPARSPNSGTRSARRSATFAPPCRKASRARSSTTSSAPPTATSMRSPARASTMR
ncbi:efflux RND transporter permease subunit [Pseudomonas aeruginosa]|nr:efflux RND transporter permease subunit [Pseudomonas aeruginosa]